MRDNQAPCGPTNVINDTKLHSYNKYMPLKTCVTNGEVINNERCHLQEKDREIHVRCMEEMRLGCQLKGMRARITYQNTVRR